MFQNLISFLLASTLTVSSMSADLPAQSSFDDRSLLTVTELPTKDPAFLAPGTMSAQSILAIDVESKMPLYQEKATVQRPIASLTKLMTGHIILEENNPDEIVTVSADAASTPGSSMGLVAGEEITVRDLLYGLLVKSGNDAAYALAEHNAGDADAFIDKMNAEAERMGLESTIYTDPSGLNPRNRSTARDLGVLSTQLIQNPDIREIVGTTSIDLTSVSGQEHHLPNTNILLGQLGIQGLKTGKTQDAGECFIAFATSETGDELITIVLASNHRFADTKVLLDWIYRAYTW